MDTNEQSQKPYGSTLIFWLPKLARRETNNFRTQLLKKYVNGVQEVNMCNEKLLCDKTVVPRPFLNPDCCFPSFLFGVRNKPVEKGITALKDNTGLDVPIPISIANKQLEKLSLQYSGQLQRHLDCSVFTSERKTKSNSKDNILF